MPKSISWQTIFGLLIGVFFFVRPLPAGDLGRLTNEQVSQGYGQLQDGPANPTADQEPSQKSSRRYPSQASASSTNCDDQSISSFCTELALGVIGAAAYGVYQTVDPPGYSLWKDQDILPEFQLNAVWYFESRSNQQLLVGQPMSNASRFDWTGTPGFQVRLATQPLVRLGSEFIFEFAQREDQLLFPSTTDFSTYPNISFADNPVSTERASHLASGQWNFLLREQPNTFAFAGLRWWHQDDRLNLNVIPSGASWENQSNSDAPFLQLGGQYGALGTRWMWINRVGVGVGASRNRSYTTVSRVVGVTDLIESKETHFSAIIDFKSEFAVAISKRFSLRMGTQLIGISGRIRSAEQIAVTNLATYETDMKTESILLSALFAGANYQF